MLLPMLFRLPMLIAADFFAALSITLIFAAISPLLIFSFDTLMMFPSDYFADAAMPCH